MILLMPGPWFLAPKRNSIPYILRYGEITTLILKQHIWNLLLPIPIRRQKLPFPLIKVNFIYKIQRLPKDKTDQIQNYKRASQVLATTDKSNKIVWKAFMLFKIYLIFFGKSLLCKDQSYFVFIFSVVPRSSRICCLIYFNSLKSFQPFSFQMSLAYSPSVLLNLLKNLIKCILALSLHLLCP